jgi:uncharacterized GH25 family protein
MKLSKHLGAWFLALALCLALPLPALAHFLWLSPSDFIPKEGNRIKIYVCLGHRFPLQDFFETSRVTGLELYGPQGKAVKVPALNEFMFQTEALSQPGVYLAATEKKPGFFTTLDKGFARKPKPGLKGVKKCSQFLYIMKSIVVVGQGGQGDVSRRIGQPLELVPLDNPAQLKPGDFMRIQVLLKGKPLRGAFVYATYAGFSDLGAFAYTNQANRDGIFTLRILRPGTWLVHVKHEQDYPDPKECDLLQYNSSLTFLIK